MGISAPDVECYSCEKGGSSYPLTSWKDVEKRFNYVAEWQPYAGPGGFNDYDSIEVGNGSNDGLTPDERQTQLSLWALGSSPFILGVDLTHLDQLDLQYLKNAVVLAVDQDSIAAKRVRQYQHPASVHEEGIKRRRIVGLFNTGSKAETVSIERLPRVFLRMNAGYSLENLWTGKIEKTGSTIDATVPSHGVVLYRVRVL